MFETYKNRLMKAAPLLLLVSFLAAVIAWAVASSVRPSYEVHFSYLVSLSEREEASDFRFDGFYAIQATDLFAATLAKWVQTPEVIQAAHEQADLPLTSNDPRQFTRLVRAEKTAPQLVEVTVQYDDPDKAQRLTEGLIAVIDQNIDRYHDQGIPAVQFRAFTTEPWQGATTVAVTAITLATFVAVLFVGINVVLLVETARQQAITDPKSGGSW